jgi:signal recognition particle receptor subunit beta
MLPYVVQYNKRDLPSAVPVEELRKVLNTDGVPDFESIAMDTIGVFETLKAIVKLVLIELKKGA